MESGGRLVEPFRDPEVKDILSVQFSSIPSQIRKRINFHKKQFHNAKIISHHRNSQLKLKNPCPLSRAKEPREIVSVPA